MSHGVYEFEIPRDWFVKAAPFLKTLTGILSLALPVASSASKDLFLRAYIWVKIAEHGKTT